MEKGPMKTVSVFLIVAIVIIIIGLLAIMIAGILGVPVFKGATVKNDNGILVGGGLNYQLYTDESIDASDLQKIAAEYRSDGVTIFYHDNNTVRLMEYMSFEPTAEQRARISNNNGVLTITGGERPRNVIGFYMVKVELYLPESYRGALEMTTSSGSQSCGEELILSEFSAKASSGSLKYDSITAESVRLLNGSGAIKADEIIGKTEISSKSGSITCSGIEGETIDIDATSGSLRVGNIKGEQNIRQSSGSAHIGSSVGNQTIDKTSGSITVESFDGFQKITTSSGSIRCLDGRGGGSYSSTSGSISVEFNECPTQDIEMNASSGGLRLTIPEESKFSFTADTANGSVSTYFDKLISTRGDTRSATLGEPEFELSMRTTTGSIKVNG